MKKTDSKSAVPPAARKQQFTFEIAGQNVGAVRFVNPDGSTGGWVATNAEIGKGAYIDRGAVVGPCAKVPSGSHVPSGAIVSPKATFE